MSYMWLAKLNLLSLCRKLVFCWHGKDLQILSILLGVAGLARAGFRARIPATGDSGYLPAPENHTRFVDSGGNRLCGPIV